MTQIPKVNLNGQPQPANTNWWESVPNPNGGGYSMRVRRAQAQQQQQQRQQMLDMQAQLQAMQQQQQPPSNTPPQWQTQNTGGASSWTETPEQPKPAAPPSRVSNTSWWEWINPLYSFPAIAGDLKESAQTQQAPTWFSAPDTWLGQLEREGVRKIVAPAVQGNTGTALANAAKDTAIGGTYQAWEQVAKSAGQKLGLTPEPDTSHLTAKQRAMAERPFLEQLASAALATPGALLTLAPKPLMDVLGWGGKRVESVIGGVSASLPRLGGALGDTVQEWASTKLFDTLNDPAAAIERVKERAKKAAAGEMPLFTFESSVGSAANSFQQSLGGDYSAKYRDKAGYDKPLNIINPEGQLFGPVTASQWATYQAQRMGFSAQDKMLSAAERIMSGEDPEIVRSGAVQPGQDAMADEKDLWNTRVTEYLDGAQRRAYAKSIRGGAGLTAAQVAGAQAREDAARDLNALGYIPGEERPLAESAFGTLVSFSPLDPANAVPVAKVFGVHEYLPKQKALDTANVMSNIFDESMRGQLNADIRGLRPEQMVKLDEIRTRQGQQTAEDRLMRFGQTPETKTQVSMLDKLYSGFLSLKERTPETQARIQAGQAVDIIQTLTADATTPDEVITRLGTLVTVPEQLTEQFGNVPISTKAEIARPVVLQAVEKLANIAQKQGPLFNPARFIADAYPTIVRAAREVAQVPDTPSGIQKLSGGMKGWMQEFFLRNPGYIIRNAASDSVILANDGLLTLDTMDAVNNTLSRLGVGREMIEGETGMPASSRSKLSNVPILGNFQNAMGDINAKLESTRRTRAWYAGFNEFFRQNWRPKISDAAREKLGPGAEALFRSVEAGWQSGLNKNELRGVVDRVLNAAHPLDTFFPEKALADAGIDASTFSPEFLARLGNQIAEAGQNSATVEDAQRLIDAQVEQVYADYRAKLANVGVAVSPRRYTADANLKDFREWQANINRIAKDLEANGVLQPGTAGAYVEDFMRPLVEGEAAITRARQAMADSFSNLPSGLDVDKLAQLIRFGMDREMGMRTNSREKLQKLLIDATRKSNEAKQRSSTAAQAGMRAAWDEYRQLRDAQWKQTHEDIANSYHWTRGAIDAFMGEPTDHRWGQLVKEGSQFGVLESAGAMTDRLINEARNKMMDAGTEAFDKMVTSNRVAWDTARRDGWSRAALLAKSDPTMAHHVFDVMVQADADVVAHAQYTVGLNYKALEAKDLGRINLEEYDAIVGKNWDEHFTFAKQRMGEYVPAQLLWAQVRNSPIALGLRNLGWDDDQIADAMSYWPGSRNTIDRALMQRMDYNQWQAAVQGDQINLRPTQPPQPTPPPMPRAETPATQQREALPFRELGPQYQTLAGDERARRFIADNPNQPLDALLADAQKNLAEATNIVQAGIDRQAAMEQGAGYPTRSEIKEWLNWQTGEPRRRNGQNWVEGEGQDKAIEEFATRYPQIESNREATGGVNQAFLDFLRQARDYYKGLDAARVSKPVAAAAERNMGVWADVYEGLQRSKANDEQARQMVRDQFDEGGMMAVQDLLDSYDVQQWHEYPSMVEEFYKLKGEQLRTAADMGESPQTEPAPTEPPQQPPTEPTPTEPTAQMDAATPPEQPPSEAPQPEYTPPAVPTLPEPPEIAQLPPRVRMDRARFAQSLGDVFGLSADEADANMALADAHASVWAKLNGRDAAEWYDTHIGDVTNTPPAADAMGQGERGAVSFEEDGRAVIHALQQPDVTTVAHELGHIFRRDLPEADMQAAAEFAGAPDGQWNVDAEERFARGFEEYLRTNRAPTSALQRVFESFAQWISRIYARLRGDVIEQIPEHMRKVYDRMLTTEEPGALVPVEGPKIAEQPQQMTWREAAAWLDARMVKSEAELSARREAVLREQEVAAIDAAKSAAQQMAEATPPPVDVPLEPAKPAEVPTEAMPAETQPAVDTQPTQEAAPTADTQPETAPTAPELTQPPTASGVEMRLNPSQNGVELRFSGKPNADTLARIKAAGFRWSARQKLWYAKQSPRTLEAARGLSAPVETAKSRPVEAVSPQVVPPAAQVDTQPTQIETQQGQVATPPQAQQPADWAPVQPGDQITAANKPAAVVSVDNNSVTVSTGADEVSVPRGEFVDRWSKGELKPATETAPVQPADATMGASNEQAIQQPEQTNIGAMGERRPGGGDVNAQGGDAQSTVGLGQGTSSGEVRPTGGRRDGLGSGDGDRPRRIRKAAEATGGRPVDRPDGRTVIESPDGGRVNATPGAIRTSDANRGRDYAISPADEIGAGGAKTKLRQNIRAIEIIKQLKAEGRNATPEEQAQLVKFVGWGGLSQALDPRNKFYGEWADTYQTLEKLLTPEEMQTAFKSTINAHYTSPPFIQGMWAAMRRLGVDGGRMLEPGMGIGHFFGLMPPDMVERSQRVGVEMDKLTGEIARQLYQNADISISPYQETRFPKNFFDVAIGNVPFGNVKVHDPAFKGGREFLTSSLHDYFFAKALDHVRPGGVIGFITSRFTMDKTDPRVRNYLAENADLLGAIRLPNNAFKGNAMTEVTTDVIFLRKRAPGEAPAGESWGALGNVKSPNGEDIPVNEYFVRHPEMMLGRMELSGSMYRGNEPALVSDGRPFDAAMQEAIARLPEGAYRPVQRVSDDNETIVRMTQPRAEVKNGNYIIGEGGKVRVATPEGIVDAKFSAEQMPRARGMIEVRDAAQQLLRMQIDPATAFDDAGFESQRAKVNQLYDTFVSKHGSLHEARNARLLADDPDVHFLLALEKWNPENKTAIKSAIFNQRVVGQYRPTGQAATVADGLVNSLFESGRVDVAKIAKATGKDAAAVMGELGNRVFENPEGGVEMADAYLSGNVREKLRAAQEAARLDPRYERNVQALQGAMPKELGAGDIIVQLGQGWIPPDVVSQFITHIVGGQRPHGVRYMEAAGSWTISEPVSYSGYNNVAASRTWGTEDLNAVKLIDLSLNSRRATVMRTEKGPDGSKTTYLDEAATNAARAKQEAIETEFAKWVWSDMGRVSDLTQRYNERYNSIVPRKFDGSMYRVEGRESFPGKVPDSVFKLRDYQADVVWRIVQGGNTLLAHEVGAGKTATMITAGMEMRRLGIRRKPLYAVLNSTLKQWVDDFTKLYPAAKILAATEEEFGDATLRQRFMARIATGDYDAIIMPHTSLGKLPVSGETYKGFMGEQIDAMRDWLTENFTEEQQQKDRTAKQIAKRIDNMEAKLQDALKASEKDQGVTFEELGIDHIFVDESHEFKNLFYYTNKDSKIKGMGDKEGSDRATDLYLKTRYLTKRNNGGGVTFATGTPVSNSMVELYTIMRYLQPNLLKEWGMEHFDAWAKQFAVEQTGIEYTASGKYQPVTRLAQFLNFPDLMNAFSSVADIKTHEDLKIPRPNVKGGAPQGVAVPAPAGLPEYVRQLAQRADSLKGEKVEKGSDNMLVIMGDAKKASLDMRLVNPDAPDDPNSKINNMVRRVKATYDQYAEHKAGQLVFIDMAAPQRGKKKAAAADDADVVDVSSKFDVYQDIKDKLVKMGIPAKEIAFIQDYDKATKQKLFDAVNNGDIRVVLGSTKMMGTGVNMQKRLIAAHHLDVPWRPSDLEQRNGRIIRNGNMFTDLKIPVEVNYYTTKGSLDEALWSMIQAKSGFVGKFMRGNTTQRRVNDDSDAVVLTAAQMRAITNDNPLVFEQIKVENDLRKYTGLQSSHEKNQRSMRYDIMKREAEIKNLVGESIPTLEQAASVYKANAREQLRIELGGRVFDRASDDQARAKAGAEIKRILADRAMAIKQVPTQKDEPMQIGRFNGFDLDIVTDQLGMDGIPNSFKLRVKMGGKVIAQNTLDVGGDTGNITRIENATEIIPGQVDRRRADLQKNRDELAGLQEEIKRPFEHADKVAQLTKRYEELLKALGDSAPVEDNPKPMAGPEVLYQSAPGVPDGEPPKYGENVTPDVLAKEQDKAMEQHGDQEGIRYADMLDAAVGKQVEGLKAIREAVGKHWQQFDPNEIKSLPKGARDVLMEELARVSRDHYDTTSAAKTYATKRTDFSLLDYGDKRGFDQWLSLVAPFSYWGTRQGRNYALRMMGRPALLAAYLRYRDAMEKENRRRGTRKRFEGAFRIPGTDMYMDPMQYIFPFAGMVNTNWNDAKESQTTMQQLMGLSQTFGFRLNPVADTALRYSNLMVQGTPGTPEYDQQRALYGRESIGQLLPQSGLIQGATALAGIGGPAGVDIEAPIRSALGLPEAEQWDAYRAARSVRDMANEKPISQQEQAFYLLAQELLKNHAGQDWRKLANEMTPEQAGKELNVPPPVAAQALALAREGIARSTQQRGTSQLSSFLGGMNIKQLPQGETNYWDAKNLERAAAYNPATGVGSRADVEAVRQQNPGLAVGTAQYGALPGESRDIQGLYASNQRGQINDAFDRLKDAVIAQKPWDRRAASQIENARWAALGTVRASNDGVNSAPVWQAEYQKAVAALTGQSPAEVSALTADYTPRSTAGASPTEALQIRKDEAMRFIMQTQPVAEQFTNPDDGSINWDAYNEAKTAWARNLPMISAGLPAVAAIVGAADAEKRGGQVRTWLNKLGTADVSQYRARNDTPFEAFQRTYFEAVYDPVMQKYREASDNGDPAAFDNTIGAIGEVGADTLLPLIQKRYPDRFDETELNAMLGMKMPPMQEVMRGNMSDAAKRKDEARSQFWNFMQTMTPPGRASSQLRDMGMIGAALDQSSRSTLTAEQYRLAASMAAGWVNQQYPEGVTPEMQQEWAQARAEKKQLDALLMAKLGQEGMAGLQQYEAAPDARTKEMIRRRVKGVAAALALRQSFAAKHKIYSTYYKGARTRR